MKPLTNYKIRVWLDEDGDWLGCIDSMPKYITHSEDGSLSGAIEWVGKLLEDLKYLAADDFIDIAPPDLPEGATSVIVDFGDNDTLPTSGRQETQ